MYGPGGKGQKADPRPVGDKGYMQQCIRALIAFLSSQGYDRALTPKALQLPSIKDFNAIVLFLFKRVDPNLALDGKFDEEVVQARLGGVTRGASTSTASLRPPVSDSPSLFVPAAVQAPLLPLPDLQVVALRRGRPPHVAGGAGGPGVAVRAAGVRAGGRGTQGGAEGVGRRG